jgi:hypothetical protein
MHDHLRVGDTKLACRCALALALAGTLVVVQGCSSDESPANPQGDGGGQTDSGACPAGGGPDPGPAVDHCMGMFTQTGMCMMGGDDAGDTDAGAEPEPATNVGNEADDDDCKYHVSFTNDCVRNGGAGTTFTVTLKSTTGTKALVPHADTSVEAFIANHPAGGALTSTETSPGVYNVGPVIFDRAGKWTVRFHFFETCSDLPEDSPHGHAAFFINVPN